jgi:hypothetical protein
LQERVEEMTTTAAMLVLALISAASMGWVCG